MGRKSKRDESKGRDKSGSKSPPRKSKRDESRGRDRKRDRSRSRSRGGRENKEDWGSKGTIKQLKGSGFGFIRPTSGQVNGSDLYFHAKECHKDSPFDELQLDDTVTYKAERDDRKGKRMVAQVKLEGGGSKKKKSSRDDSRDRGRSGSRSRSKSRRRRR